MRIDQASKLMGIPIPLIREIITDNQIKVEEYMNGNHDLPFEAMLRIHAVYQGTYRSDTDWRATSKRLRQKVKRLEERVEKLKAQVKAQPKVRKPRITTDELFERKKKNWYPRRRRNEVVLQSA